MIGIDSSASERLCLTLLHSLWQVALLALTAWGIGRCLGRHRENASYVVHATALAIGLIAAPITHVFLSYGGSTPVAESAPPLVAVASVSADLAPDVSQLPFGFAAAAEIEAPSPSAVPLAPAASLINAAPSFAWQSIMSWLAGAYFFGVVLMFVRLARSAFLLERLRATAQPVVDGPVFNALTNVCNQWSLKTAPVLAHAEQVVVPKVVGLLKPTILLPSSALTGLTIDDLELILAHELAHVRRHDLWINLLQRLAEAILFFNPAMWWLSRRVSTLREYCCDDRACAVIPEGAKPQLRYAEALLHAVELQHTGSSEQVAALAATGRSPSELRRRVARLFGEQIGESIRLSRGSIAVLFAGALLLLISPTVAETALSNTSSLHVSFVGPDSRPVGGVGVELRGLPDFDQAQVKIGEFVEKRRYGVSVRADASGQLVLDLGKQPPRNLGLHIKEPGYGPYWANWDSSDHPEPIPSEFTVRLERGWSVGGIVVDEAGQPVANAKVRPSIEYKKRPGDTRQMGVGARVTTVADGSWRFDSVPESYKDVSVEITHPDQSTLIASLARGSYEVAPEGKPSESIVMQSGLVVAGRVTDSAGRPVVGATVRTKFHNDVRKATTNDEGKYQLVGCKPKMARIVVSAAGKAMELAEVRVDPDMEPVDFVMQPGGKIRIKVVDENGVGIPKARIFFQSWRGRIDYFEFDHVNQYANDQGIWEWSEAPLDEFEADICRPGGMQLTYQKLQAGAEEYVFSPPSKLSVSGKVVDAETGAPIKKFRVVRGLRNKDARIGVVWIEYDAYDATDGAYRVTFDRVPIAAIVRVEAIGYRVKTSRDIQANEGKVAHDFELERQSVIASTILTPSGKPATEAKIAVGVAGSQISIKNGDIGDGQTYAQRLRSDAEGRFELPPRDDAFQLVITHDEGFAHLKSSDGPVPAQIKLTPWARVEGTFRVGAKPAPGVVLALNGDAINSYGPDVPNIFTHHNVTTGPEGRYAFDRVFPGKGRIGRRILLMVNEGATEVTSSSRVAAEFIAGETTQLDIGGSGRPVTGELLPPEGYSDQVLWNFAMVSLEADLSQPAFPVVPEESRDNGNKQAAWWKEFKETPQGKAWSAAYQKWQTARRMAPYLTASVDRDGAFRFDDTPSGDYVLQVRYDERIPGTLETKVRVPAPAAEGYTDQPVELGALKLSARPAAATLPSKSADEPEPVKESKPAERTKPAEKVSTDLREMRIRILDESGKPLAGAKLRVGVWYVEGYEGPRTPKKHTADDEGRITLQLPKRLRILRLWPKQPKYVGEFKNFAEGTHREGELLPKEFDFRLAKGHTIGGRVVDADGNPIAGTHVRVRADDTEPGDMVSTWLTDSFNQPTVKTDAEGRWRLDNAPAPREDGTDCKFVLKLDHDDYISDEHWGEAQRTQGVTVADLRSSNATVVLYRGKSVTGVVSDAEGNPVTKGWVVWSDTPYFSDGTWEAAIEKDGRFVTPQLSDGEHPITIVAPGFAAQRRVVTVGGDRSELRFALTPGRRIEIRFIDKAGDPIPKAGVYLANNSFPNTWQGSNALHNHKHPNVPDYGIRRKADENGVFVWDWAPEEPVTYSVGAKGYASQEVSLVAKSEPHVITLADARVVVGRVTDATTGEPIKNFQAMPVIVFRPNFFSTRYSDTKQGVGGNYELPLTGSADPKDRYRVRFEADGYRSVVSNESFGPQDGRVELNIRLEPAAARKGRVVNADGEPVAGAMVLEGTPTWVPSIYNSKPGSYGERIVRTDSNGRFQLNATTEPVRVRVLHDKGIAERFLDPADALIGDVPLQPWAKVSGRLLQAGQPMGNQRIYFDSLVPRGLGEARFQGNAQTLTAADGTFSFERVPPEAGSMRVALGPWRDSPLTSAKGLPLTLQPGEERQIVLGGEGAIITGRVIATGRDEAPLNRKWSLNHLVKRESEATVLPPGFPELSFDPAGQVQPSWTLDPHYSHWVATRENHFVKLTPEGDVRITGVSPGQYDLVLRLYEQPAGCLVETVGEKIVPVRVEGDGTIDLGQIEVPCRSGPRVGSDMRGYEFVDATGRKKTINDMAGQHVVLHVWATWCGPCLTSMPDVAATVEQLDGKPITFVGLNIDADRDGARGLAERRGWNWAHNYLGDDSDLARQLAISSVPTYYLVGPDGRLVAASTEWKSIRQAVADELLPRVSQR